MWLCDEGPLLARIVQKEIRNGSVELVDGRPNSCQSPVSQNWRSTLPALKGGLEKMAKDKDRTGGSSRPVCFGRVINLSINRAVDFVRKPSVRESRLIRATYLIFDSKGSFVHFQNGCLTVANWKYSGFMRF
jgi:hypothetical protein